MLTFEVNEPAEALESLRELDGKLTIEVKKYRAKRSLDANAYFWALCGQIAAKLGTTKERIYIAMIRDAGPFQDFEIVPEALEMLKRAFRYTEILGSDERLMVRCYPGSSTYNSEEMSRLIDVTIEEAKGLGIDTLTPDEVAAMKAAWEAKGYGY